MRRRYLLVGGPGHWEFLADRFSGKKLNLSTATPICMQGQWSAQAWKDLRHHVRIQRPDFELPESPDEFDRCVYTVEYKETTQERTSVEEETSAGATVLMRHKLALDRRCRPSPLRVYLGIWNRCNLECSYCCAKCSKNRPGHFTREEVGKIVRHLYKLGVVEVRLGESGEPTQHPDLEEIIVSIKNAGLFLSLNTNGVMTAQRRAFVAESGLIDLLIVSLDGLGEAHDRNRGNGTYKATLETIRQAVEGHTRVRFNYVINNQTADSLEDLANLANDFGAEIYTLPMRPSGRAEKDFDRYLEGLSWVDIIQRIQKLRDKFPSLSIHSTYDIHMPSGDHLVDHAGCCPAGVEGCCLSPMIGERGTAPARIRMFGCTFLADAGQPFLAAVFNDLETFYNRFFDTWQTRFEPFRSGDLLDNTCQRCNMLKQHRCTGHCAALGYYKILHPKFDPTVYCALEPSFINRPILLP